MVSNFRRDSTAKAFKTSNLEPIKSPPDRDGAPKTLKSNNLEPIKSSDFVNEAHTLRMRLETTQNEKRELEVELVNLKRSFIKAKQELKLA